VAARQTIKEGSPPTIAGALLLIAARLWTQPAVAPVTSSADDIGVLAQQIKTQEAMIVAVDARERAHSDELMKMMIGVKEGIARIEAKVDTAAAAIHKDR